MENTIAHKKDLADEFFKRVPKARRIDPFFNSIFEFMYGELTLRAIPLFMKVKSCLLAIRYRLPTIPLM